ncbi:hypothetical protein B1A99_10925 [Cohnella sp. CIP 111063]|nr:hypothetical protein B1A99_10925 [Cohnella sp. CIP 111063]
MRGGSGMNEGRVELEWRIPSRIGCEKRVMRKVAAAVAGHCPGEERSEEMATAVAEACLNAIEHGNRLVSRLPVTVRLTVDSEKYRIRVFDQGSAVPEVRPDSLTLAERWQAERPRGWGLRIIDSLADRFAFASVDGGVCLEMIFFKRGVEP